jgi:hypothetical protein
VLVPFLEWLESKMSKYLYIRNSYTRDEEPNKRFFKVGETDNLKKREGGYTPGNPQSVYIYEKEVNKPTKYDKVVINEIGKHPRCSIVRHTSKRNSEVIEVPKEMGDDEFISIVESARIAVEVGVCGFTNDFSLRPIQEKGSEALVRTLVDPTYHRHFLLEAYQRYGKNHTVAHSILLRVFEANPSFPTTIWISLVFSSDIVEDSYNDLRSHVSYKNSKIIRQNKDFKKGTPIVVDSTPTIAIMTVQYFIKNFTAGTVFSNIRSELENATMSGQSRVGFVIDEIQRGASVSGSKLLEILSKYISASKIVPFILMSGTPYRFKRDAYQKFFITKDNTFIFTLLDALAAKKRGEDWAQVVPERLFIGLKPSDYMKEQVGSYTGKDLFHVMESDDGKVLFFTHAPQVEAFNRWFFSEEEALMGRNIYGKAGMDLYGNMLGQENDLGHMRVGIQLFSRISECSAQKRSLEKIGNVHVICAYGNDNGGDTSGGKRTIGHVKDEIKKFKSGMTGKRFCVILTCGKCTTGVSLPDADYTMLMTEREAVETMFQYVERSSTPHPNKKTSITIFLTLELACVLKSAIIKAQSEKDGKSESETLTTYGAFLPIVADTKNGPLKEISESDYFTAIKTFAEFGCYDRSGLDLNIDDIWNNIDTSFITPSDIFIGGSGGKGITSNMVTNDSGIDTKRSIKNERNSKGIGKSKQDKQATIEERQRQTCKVYANIGKNFIWLSDSEIPTADTLVSLDNSFDIDLFKRITASESMPQGHSFKEYQRLLIEVFKSNIFIKERFDGALNTVSNIKKVVKYKNKNVLIGQENE